MGALWTLFSALGLKVFKEAVLEADPARATFTPVQYGLALEVRKGATLFGNQYLSYFCLLIQWHCTEQHISMVLITVADSNAIHGDWQPGARFSFQPTSQRTSAGIRRSAVGRPRTIVNGKGMQYYLHYDYITLITLQWTLSVVIEFEWWSH